jgi:hypothetical protein
MGWWKLFRGIFLPKVHALLLQLVKYGKILENRFASLALIGFTRKTWRTDPGCALANGPSLVEWSKLLRDISAEGARAVAAARELRQNTRKHTSFDWLYPAKLGARTGCALANGLSVGWWKLFRPREISDEDPRAVAAACESQQNTRK